MLYFDFQWDVNHDGLLLDEEINLEKLGRHAWVKGDYFKLVELENGRLKLAKVGDLEAFLLAGASENIENNKKRE